MRTRNVPLRKIRASWNNLYGYVHSAKGRGKKESSHWIEYRRGSVKIIETSNMEKDGLKDIILLGDNMLYFPSSSYRDFTMWNALPGLNCDGIVMYRNENNEISIDLVELKSTFDTSDYLKASKQITTSLQKLFLLLNGLPVWQIVDGIYVRGLVVSYEPDADAMDWIKQMEMLPKENWRYEDKIGLSLAIYNKCILGIPDDINISGLPTHIDLQRVWCASDTNNHYYINNKTE